MKTTQTKIELNYRNSTFTERRAFRTCKFCTNLSQHPFGLRCSVIGTKESKAFEISEKSTCDKFQKK